MTKYLRLKSMDNCCTGHTSNFGPEKFIAKKVWVYRHPSYHRKRNKRILEKQNLVCKSRLIFVAISNQMSARAVCIRTTVLK